MSSYWQLAHRHQAGARQHPVERFSAILARLHLTQSPEFIVIIVSPGALIIALTVITADLIHVWRP